jgi:hypothetical protein
MKNLLLLSLISLSLSTFISLWLTSSTFAADVGLGCTVKGGGDCTINTPDQCPTGTTPRALPDKSGKCYANSQCVCECSTAFGAGVPSALGCIPYTPEGLTQWILKLIAGVITGVALLLLLYGGVRYVMSSGDMEGLEEAKSIITAAISGLLLVIFSVLILRVIGVDILGLPGFVPQPGGGIEVPGGP